MSKTTVTDPAPPRPGSGGPAPSLDPLEYATRALIGLSILLALATVFFVSLRPIAVTDFWWQLKTGELIVKGGSIPRQDPFSWTAANQPWMVHEWLTEVLFYLIYAHLPQWVLLGYKCGLAAVACGLVLARGWTRTGSPALGILAALLAAYVMRNFADLRPQMLSFVLLAGLLLALDHYQQGRFRRLPWLLPGVMALWANLHGGVVVGLIVLGLWLAGQAVGRWLFRDPAPGLGPLALGLLASCAAVMLNPNGYHVYLYPFQVLGHPEVTDYISEWWSPDFHLRDLRPFEVVLLGAPGALILARGGRGERRIGEVLVLLATAHAALTTQRNTVAYALVAAPLLVAGLAGLWEEASIPEALRAACRTSLVRFGGWAAVATVLTGLMTSSVPRTPASRWYDDAILTKDFPEGAAALLAEGMWPGKMYNDYVWGGYLIWRLHPKRPVFIDGRAEVYYPTHAFDDEMKIHRVVMGWQNVLNERGVDVVLTGKNGDLARALEHEPAWKLAFTGKVEVVYVRKDGNTVGSGRAETQQ